MNIYENFINSDENNIINNIKLMKKYVYKIDKKSINQLINEINNKINIYSYDQNIYLALKSLNIYCNKYLSKNNIIKRINNILDAIKSTCNIKRIIFYVKKILYYIENNNIKINYSNVIKILENILFNNEIQKDNNTEYILILINKCKKINKITYDELENVLLKIDSNINDYIYFLKNKNILDSKENIIDFLQKLSYTRKDNKDIDKLDLKRGFVHCLTKNNKDYILKYQPNKSVLELIFNTHIKLINSKYFLTPSSFIINSNNSYFYVIEKYETDLYKYFNILHNNKKILELNKILEICLIIMNGIMILHKNNIIHCDLKLENIVVNLDENKDICDLRIIDFDVSVFNIIPENLNKISEKYLKILNHKKKRGTRIYMLKNDIMTFESDIYSFGVVLLILLYKSIKLIINKNKKICKKLNSLKENIEDDNVKIETLNIIEEYFKKYKKEAYIFLGNDIQKFKYFKELIIDCINHKLDIIQLYDKYNNHFL